MQTRNGPRPLPLHLATAITILSSSAGAWPMLRSGWTPWSDDLAEQGNALQKDLQSVNPEEFSSALLTELASRNDRFLTGIEKYRSHTYRRNLPVPPPLWEFGPVQLQDFGATQTNGEAGKPVLVIPSLVNRKLHHGPDRRTQFPAVPRIAGNAATPGRLGYPGRDRAGTNAGRLR